MKRIAWFITLLTLLLAASSAMAQPWMEQFRGQETEPTIQEIFDAFDAYWQDKEPAKGTGWKQFQRWRNFIETRLDENGEFHPEALWNAWEQKVEMFPNGSELDEADWQPLGPFDPIPGEYVGGLGRVNCMAQDPTNPNHMYAGAASGGLWMTFTGGFSWVPLTDDLPVLGVSDITIDYTDPSIIYIATGDCDGNDTYSIGILKSVDSGQSWNETGFSYDVLDGNKVSRVRMDTQDHLTLLATTSSGVYKTIDGGDNWDRVLVGGGFLHDLENVAATPDVWFAAASGTGVYRSTDNGENWSGLSNGIPFNGGGYNRIEVEISPSHPNQVYALFSDNSSAFYAMYKSYDGGDSWSMMSNSPNLLGWSETGNDDGGQGWYDLSLAVDPENPNIVFVGGVNVWKSTNAGADWDISGFWYYNQIPYIHADHHRHEFFMENDIPVHYAANDGGLYRTTTGGDSWEEISHGMVIQQIYRLGVSQSSAEVDMIAFGNQDNGTKLKEGDDFRAIMGGDGMESAIAPDDPDYMYAEVYYGDMRRSTDGGYNWYNGTNGIGTSGRWVTPYIIDQNNPQTMWFGTNIIYRSDNRGANWTGVSPSFGGGGGDKMTALAVAPSNSNVVYGVNPNGDVVYTTDGGDNWDSNNAPASPLTYIAVHPTNDAIIYITVGGYNAANKVFVSFNRGEDWTNLSDGLPNLPVNCVTTHPYDGSHIYIGTDVGIFFSDNGGDDWQDWSTGLPNVIVNELEFHVTSNTIVAATFGRGIWSSPAEEANVDPFLIVSAPNGGEEILVGDLFNIRWNYYDIEGNVSIEINRDYPIGDWEVLYASTPNDVVEEWTVTGPPTTNARIRITSLDNPTYTDESDDSFAIIQPSITITAPNGGEELTLGMYADFVWDSQSVDGSVSIEL
ncbi:MAG TPA: hypothetical protein ENH10_02145, partial [Bacteroidetes bacterium]|nr:hypothetical protein [Bacteroidota bacterium]HEX03942.1 hypothetical protein [Bacteroidota bacterium]